jgi:uncharacterized SAM-binding protein YcdF (DUF218 family)
MTTQEWAFLILLLVAFALVAFSFWLNAWLLRREVAAYRRELAERRGRKLS